MIHSQRHAASVMLGVVMMVLLGGCATKQTDGPVTVSEPALLPPQETERFQYQRAEQIPPPPRYTSQPQWTAAASQQPQISSPPQSTSSDAAASQPPEGVASPRAASPHQSPAERPSADAATSSSSLESTASSELESSPPSQSSQRQPSRATADGAPAEGRSSDGDSAAGLSSAGADCDGESKSGGGLASNAADEARRQGSLSELHVDESAEISQRLGGGREDSDQPLPETEYTPPANELPSDEESSQQSLDAQGLVEGQQQIDGTSGAASWLTEPEAGPRDQPGTGGGHDGQASGDRNGGGQGFDGRGTGGMPGGSEASPAGEADDVENVRGSSSGDQTADRTVGSDVPIGSAAAQAEAIRDEQQSTSKFSDEADMESTFDASTTAAAAEAAVELARRINATITADPLLVDKREEANSRGGHFEPWHRDVRGVWELDSIVDPSADFLPPDTARRLIGIDPVRRELHVYVATGSDSLEWQSVAYEAAFRRDLVEIRPFSDRPSVFSTDADLEPAAVAVPCESAWFREGDQLHLAGAVYEPSDPAEVQRIMEPPMMPAPPLAVEASGSRVGVQGVAAGSPTVDFFGIQSQGRYVAYILDVSSSMRGRMARLQSELEMSLGALPGNARFVVLPFNSKLLQLQSSWASAGSANVKRVVRSLADVDAQGGTDPSKAFEWAFRTLTPRPDEIYFMTDGAVIQAPKLLERLRVLNAGPGKTRIHSIGLGADAETGFLRAIAGEHGGRFVHIAR